MHEAPFANCRDFRRRKGLDAFPKAELPSSPPTNAPGGLPNLPRNTPVAQLSAMLRALSHRTARLFQNWWLDWCPSRYDVLHPDGGPAVRLDIRFGGQSHFATVPQYIADGLGAGTVQPEKLGLASIGVSIAYIALVCAQIVLFTLKSPSLPSTVVWIVATVAAVFTSAWLGGSPLVCSGIV
jgi:hypothetical protein